MIVLDFTNTDLSFEEARKASNRILHSIKMTLLRRIPHQKLRVREDYIKKFIEHNSNFELGKFSLINLVMYYVHSLQLVNVSNLVYEVRLPVLIRVPGTNVSLSKVMRLLEYGNERMIPLYYYRPVFKYYRDNYLDIAYKILGKRRSKRL